jgi:hypothetical protein
MNIREMEQQIEVTRHELDETLRALQARLSPTRRLRSAWSATRDGGLGAVRSGVGWALAHPVSLFALGAAAVVWAVRHRPDARRTR